MLVMKFGGTSVADSTRLRRAAELATRQKKSQPVAVVTSALAKVTDSLLEMAQLARARKTEEVEKILSELRLRHLKTAEELTPEGPKRESLTATVRELLLELDQLLHGARLLQELSPKTSDLIVSFGERLAVHLLAAAIDAVDNHGIPVDSREIVQTNDRFGNAEVDLEKSGILSRDKLTPLLATGIPVITGFLGSSADGETTTLGRGGSDYTASLIGSFLSAHEIWIWTDVDGVMTADPRVVPEARVLNSISYREAAEMAYFGSKVLHPRTMTPAVRESIPIRIRNTMNPDHPGTVITELGDEQWAGVKSVTSIPDLALVTVEGSGMIGVPGVASRVFTATSRSGVNVFMISQASSEHNISFLVHQSDGKRTVAELEREFQLELHQGVLDRIDVEAPVGIMAIIGAGMRGVPGISRKLFTALGQARINVLAIAQGSSELNLSTVVRKEDLSRAVGATHTRFGLTRDTHVFLLGKGMIGRTLITQIQNARERMTTEHDHSVKLVGVCGRERLAFDPHGLDPSILQAIADGQDLPEGSEARPSDQELVARLASTRRLDVVLVDVTDAETAELHLDALRHGFHVVTANKKAVAGPQALYEKIREQAKKQGVNYHFEATFGAGLPVLFTLQDLIATHDRIDEILGCFSGTLGFLCSNLMQGRPFSEIVLEAKRRGYTEPDPRDDLSGMDVARKALIVARELGAKLELKDIALQGLVPAEFLEGSVESFLSELPRLDEPFSAQVRQALEAGKVLRYVARIWSSGAEVGLRAVEPSSALGQLDGPDNILIYRTDRYSQNPLVIRGPGAGAEVTAAGVFGDILKVARSG